MPEKDIFGEKNYFCRSHYQRRNFGKYSGNVVPTRKYDVRFGAKKKFKNATQRLLCFVQFLNIALSLFNFLALNKIQNKSTNSIWKTEGARRRFTTNCCDLLIPKAGCLKQLREPTEKYGTLWENRDRSLNEYVTAKTVFLSPFPAFFVHSHWWCRW